MIDQLSDDFVAAYANWLGVTEGEAYQLLSEEPLEDVTDELTAAAWEESEHPRHDDGRFRRKDQGPDFSGEGPYADEPPGARVYQQRGRGPDTSDIVTLGSARDPGWRGPVVEPPGEVDWGGQTFDALEHSDLAWSGEGIGYMGYDIDGDYFDPEALEPGYRERVSEEFAQATAHGVPSISTPEGEVLDEILDSGRFKNQFETMSSGGAFHPEARAVQEEMFFGYPQDSAPEERPIYGWVDHPYAVGQARRLPRQYGYMTWRLKDEIKDRATVTAVDSLSRPVIPGPWRNPGYRAALPAGYVDRGLPTYTISDPIHENGLFDDVMEAQYHGGVTLDDVRAVDVTVTEGFEPVGAPGPPLYGVLTQQQYDRLRARGIEVNFVSEYGRKIDFPGKMSAGGGTT
jgi:hypothetical protein